MTTAERVTPTAGRPSRLGPVDATRWLLNAGERGNDVTDLDRRHPSGLAWTAGNCVTPLVHGAAYFSELVEVITATRAGDLLLFTDWRGDPDERLAGPHTEVSRLLCEAAGRGVLVRGLVWRSHWDRFTFSASENRHLGEDIEAAGGECLRDMRIRAGGSHHQKMVVVRHPGDPDRDVAYVGGIDLCHSRRDDARHRGDRQPQPIAPEYGEHPPWHDIQLAIRGPAVGDVEATFRERWNDPSPLSRNPIARLHDLLKGEDTHAGVLPPQLPDPAPPTITRGEGGQAVQVLRTYPYRRRGYPFAPGGERSIARAYGKAVGLAQSLIYVEDQYLWSAQVLRSLAHALAASPRLRVIAVVPLHPDQSGLGGAVQIVGRTLALTVLREAGGDRFALYGLENLHGTPVYVHAKACVIDDIWTCVGSDNLNLRSWTHDSELSCAVIDDPDTQRRGEGFALRLRLTLSREHLDRADGDDADLRDPVTAFDTFRDSAQRLDAWYQAGQHGPRPPGRLRTYQLPALSTREKLLARPMYRFLADPDGRPRALRRQRRF
jgi:phosphatidylserine/phosphatidylglycerophosphate/cardiolipin synthase-like enzyme